MLGYHSIDHFLALPTLILLPLSSGVRPDRCMLHKRKGTGKSMIKRYYFNVEKGGCRRFRYTGEGGNRNNFPSKAICERTCSMRKYILKFLPTNDFPSFSQVGVSIEAFLNMYWPIKLPRSFDGLETFKKSTCHCCYIYLPLFALIGHFLGQRQFDI